MPEKVENPPKRITWGRPQTINILPPHPLALPLRSMPATFLHLFCAVCSKKPNTTDSVSFCLTCVVSAPRNKSHPCIADPSFASQHFSHTAPRRASRSCFFPFETRPKTATTNCGACANLGLRLLPDRGLCNRAWLVGVGWNKRLMPISGLGGVSGWWRAM